MKQIDNLFEFPVEKLMTTDLIYYFKEHETELLDFCIPNNITYLPCIDGKFCYKVDKKKFIRKEIKIDTTINKNKSIFSEDVLRKFSDEKFNVIFVVNSENLIEGIVHICDFNKPAILLHIYEFILNLELALRELLIAKGYKNENIIDKAKVLEINIKKWQKRIMPQVSQFQAFCLADLLKFAFSIKLISGIDFNKIAELRNMVAHGQDMVINLPNFEIETGLLFNTKDLNSFIDKIKIFSDCYKIVYSEHLCLQNLKKLHLLK